MEKRKDKKGIVLRAGEYQRPNGRYEYKYTDNDGHRRSVTADTLKQLRQLEDAISRDKLDGIHAAPDVTVDDLYGRWLKVKRGLKSNTLANYKYMYAHFAQPIIGRKSVKTLRKSDIQMLYNHLADESMAVNTLDNVHNVLYQILSVGVEDDLLRRNPAEGALKELKKGFKQPQRHALTLPEQDRLLAAAAGTKWYDIIAVALHTGLRVGEFTALQWSDVSLSRRIITVRHNRVYYRGLDGKQVAEVHSTKTEAGERIVPLDDVAAVTLSRMHQDGAAGYVFSNRYGDPYTAASINRAIKRIITAANKDAAAAGTTVLPDISFHIFRHTYCTNLCRAGVDIRTIMDIMGHADIQTTMGIYAEATADMRASAADRLSQYTGKQSTVDTVDKSSTFPMSSGTLDTTA